MNTRPCPVCKETQGDPLFHQSFSGFGGSNLLKSYDVISCKNCGLCYADKIPEQAVFDTYYRELSKYENIGTELHESPYDRNRFQIMVDYMTKFIPGHKAHIVEVGCATGFLLSMIDKAGYHNITGVDPSPACAATAKKYYNLKVLANTLSDIPLEKDSVDFLLLVGVLEHVRDLDDSLKRLKNLLAPGGKFFIAVPDASQYHNGLDAPFQEFSVEHINFFGPDSLENLLRRYGFSKLDHNQTLIEVNHNTLTPVLMAVFEKDENNSALKPVDPDLETRTNLETYIANSRKREAVLTSTIDKIVNAGTRIVIWGTGAQTLRLLANSNLGKAKITAFVDSNPKYQGKTLNELPIISPQSLRSHTEPILISTRAYQNEIESQIRNELNLKNEVIKLY